MEDFVFSQNSSFLEESANESSSSSNSGSNATTSSVTFIFQEEYKVFTRVVVGITFMFAVFGVSVNVINLRTFYKLGLKDGITVSLFALAICDFCYLVVYMLLRIMGTIVILEEEGILWLPIQPSVFSGFIAMATLIFSSVGMFAVSFLAVARCLCVSMPLHFKNIFTKSRCIAFYVSFFLISVSAYIPVAVLTPVEDRLDPVKNKTRPSLGAAPGRKETKDKVHLIFGTILPVIFEIILIICVFIMIQKLRESAKFRQSQNQGQNDEGKGSEVKWNQRDRRVVIQVVLISIIYIMANIPKMFQSLYGQFEAQYDIGKKYMYVLFMMSDVRFFSESVNSTANFFVYFKYNSAFRKACFQRSSKSKLARRSETGSSYVNSNQDSISTLTNEGS